MTNLRVLPSSQGVWFRFQILTPPHERGRLARYGVMLVSLAVVVYLRVTLARWLEWDDSLAFLLAAIFISAWFGGARIGLIATALATAIGWEILHVFVLAGGLGAVTHLVIFAVKGVVVTGVCCGLQRAIDHSRSVTAEAARHFEIMANNAPVLIWSTNSDGHCVFVNRNWLAFTGEPPLEPRDHHRPGRFHPADLGRYEAVAGEAIAERKPFKLEYRLRRADGAYRWLLEQAVPRFDRDGRFEGYIGSCSDVTDSRHEREELGFISRFQGALSESLDLDRCAEILVQSFVPRIADWCCVELVNDDGRLERVRVHRFEPSSSAAPVPAVAAFAPIDAAGYEAQIVRTGEPLLLHVAEERLWRTVAGDEEHYQRLRTVGKISFLGVPLRARGHIIGVLAFATAESGRVLGDAERHLVQKVAGIAGFALDNARLYRHARRALAAEELARREMMRSERRFQFVWDANIFGVGTITRSGRILTANAALAELLGYTADEIEAGSAMFSAHTAETSRADDTRALDELRRTGRCTPFEKEYVRPDGSTAQVLVCGSQLPEGDEWMAFVFDLTARRHAEHALDRQRMLLKTIIDAMPAMVGYVGTDERLRLHNEKYAEWLGLQSDAIDGRTMLEIFGADAHERVAPYLRAAFRGRNMRHETTVFTADRHRHIIATYRPDRDPAGRVCGVVVHAYDITERKETEQALADALTRYRFLADAMPQMVWTARPDGEIDYVNHRWLESTGLTETGSFGREGWLAAIHPDDRDAVRTCWNDAIAQGAPLEHECRLRCTGASEWRWHLVRALPRRDDSRALMQWVASATDIDEQRRAYAELAEAREHLHSHAEDLEARVRLRTATLREANSELEAFTYSVSHDLRTPLQFMRGFAEAIQEDADNHLSPANRDYLHRIIRAAERMDTIIQDLLAYSRLSRAEMQLGNVPLKDVVTEVLAHQHAFIRQTRATVAIESPLPGVCADRTGLFQVVSNLVSNALKFARPGCPPSVRIRAETADGAVRLWVEDDGIGIEPRHHDRIFQMFERLHSAAEYPGTGIG
ncbi:MAG TPA: PAS domain S-box protein, partial [Opitutus sp.]|nr:PAS domain S-box protein [Opitutus sp.]